VMWCQFVVLVGRYMLYNPIPFLQIIKRIPV
jgi:hypothetical protein